MDNLYKVWNGMPAGSYFLLPVRAVEIPKVGGGTRTLGVPRSPTASIGKHRRVDGFQYGRT